MKEKYFNSIGYTLTDLIPNRKIVQTNDFVNLNNLKNTNNFDITKCTDLIKTVAERSEYYTGGEYDKPRFCYIAHQKKDGIIAAKSLYEKLLQKHRKKDKINLVFNPHVDEKMLASYIKNHGLKKAMELGYVKKNKIPLLTTVPWTISGILLVLDFFTKIFDLTNLTGDSTFSNLLGKFNFNVIITLVLIALFVVSLCLLIVQIYKNQRNLKIELNKVLADMDAGKFIEFIREFNNNDFHIPDCNRGKSVYICVLQNYTIKEKYILKSYWCNSSMQQIWWIFAEGINENDDFIIPESDLYERQFFYQRALSKEEKAKIAKVIYTKESKISPSDDSGINLFGVDYLCRFQLKSTNVSHDINLLNKKIGEFCNEYNVGYQTDTRLIIRLVADLSCTYGFDFTERKKWQYLFDDSLYDSSLNELDKQITDELGLRNQTFKNLIPEIMKVFSDDLEEIVASHLNNEQTSDFEQWCIVKALKTQNPNDEECYFAICDTLLAEFANCADTPEYIGSSQRWKDILVKTAEIFYQKQFFWFLPTLLHNIIHFFEGRIHFGEKLFSQDSILAAARAIFLLSISSETENYSFLRIDLIKDHYKIVCAAAEELYDMLNLDENTVVPLSFDLLQLTNQERKKYYTALCLLEERAVIDFINYMFDLFLMVVFRWNKFARICYDGNYKSLYSEKLLRYAVEGNRHPFNGNRIDHIEIISLKILDLLDTVFDEKFIRIKNLVCELKQYISSETEVNRSVDVLLILIVEFDILGFNTLNFISCLLGRYNDSKKMTKDIYLSFGNYLLGIVFLTYYETSRADFLNDDFKYLVDICIKYPDPSGAILGLMYSCSERPMPHSSGECIINYIQNNHQFYLENINRFASEVSFSDIEDLLIHLSCTKCVSEEEKLKVFKEVKKVIEDKYMSFSQSLIYLELSSLYLNGESTPVFRESQPIENIERILKASDNMVYLIYEKYINCYKDEYIEYYHMVVSKILNSAFSNKIHLLIFCLFENEVAAYSDEFVSSVHLIFDAIDNSYLSVHRIIIDGYITFLFRVLHFFKNKPEVYNWTDEMEIMRKIEKFKQRMSELLFIQTQEFCALRTWNNYGIAIFLREILLSNIYPTHCPENYNGMEKADKIEYIVEQFEQLQPFVIINNTRFFNLPYVDMLSAFINNDGHIQDLLDEKESMNKLISDLYDIVDFHSILSPDAKARIRGLLLNYMRRIG